MEMGNHWFQASTFQVSLLLTKRAKFGDIYSNELLTSFVLRKENFAFLQKS